MYHKDLRSQRFQGIDLLRCAIIVQDIEDSRTWFSRIINCAWPGHGLSQAIVLTSVSLRFHIEFTSISLRHHIGLTSSLSNACIYIDLYFGLSNACIDRDICKKLRSTYHTHSRRAKQSHMQESHIFSRARHSIPSVVVMKLLIQIGLGSRSRPKPKVRSRSWLRT